MIVYKFGGASVKNAAGIKNVVKIIQQSNAPLAVVVSAMGKMTNALEQMIQCLVQNDPTAFRKAWNVIRDFHVKEALTLDCIDVYLPFVDAVELELFEIAKQQNDYEYDALYDQIIGFGERLSSVLLGVYLNQSGVKTQWVSASDLIITNQQHRRASILWKETEQAVQNAWKRLEPNTIMLTQGFVGSTPDGIPTSLGREGSDYTAAVLSYCLNAEHVTIWKDVPGVLTADPRRIPDATLIPELSYREAIELTYYGAQVIHPKTIQPIQIKQTPMYVRSFVHPDGQGTCINQTGAVHYPPMIVFKDDQYLLTITTLDYSFVSEAQLSIIFSLFTKFGVTVQVMRNSAISFVVCISCDSHHFGPLMQAMKTHFNVQCVDGVQLLTIRHFTESLIESIKMKNDILFEERYKNTYQLVRAI